MNNIQADPNEIFALLGRKTFEAEYWQRVATQLQAQMKQSEQDKRDDGDQDQ